VALEPLEGGFDGALTAQIKDRKGRTVEAERVCLTGRVELADEPPQCSERPPGEPPQGWYDNRYPDQGLLVHGPPLRCLVQCTYQYDGGWGRIVAPPPGELAGPRGGEGWIVPVAVLDACVVACGSWVYLQFGGRVEVPFGFERLTLVRPPRTGERCTLRLFFRGRDERHSRFDFTLFGEDGSVVLDARGYRTILLVERA
jgi:hypothetical protein